jgi:hypothetical protein
LRNGDTNSCGCLKLEVLAKRATHGATRYNQITPEYQSWLDMHKRCSNPRSERFNAYGGRGISVCERWSSFENFLSDMGPRPEGYSIERNDVNGNYEQSNCKWIPYEDQYKNRRPIDNNGTKNPFFGKQHSEETKQKLRDSAFKRLSEKGNPFLGKRHSEETKQKLRLAALRQQEARRKKIQDEIKSSS